MKAHNPEGLTFRQIPYRRQYRTGLADTFDVYLTILSLVEAQIMGALGRDDPDWQAVHGCPACSYEVQFTRDIIGFPKTDNRVV